MIDAKIKAEIQHRLEQLSGEENIQILLAVESGSRAWGFASANSDYDVRFLYLRAPDWYLSIDLEKRRDVIERPIVDDIDLAGWDIRKALVLMRKSNPALLEWLDSPMIYAQDEEGIKRLQALIPHCFSPTNLRHHYLRMAQITVDRHLRKDQIVYKKYFYALRPLLALRWLEQGHGPVPMRFAALRETLDPDSKLNLAIEELLERKRAGQESDTAAPIPIISQFIDSELARQAQVQPHRRGRLPEIEPLNQYFRWLLRRRSTQHPGLKTGSSRSG
jgi:uncharacterized protein